MGKTRDLFKKIRDTKGTFHAKMGSIKDRNSMDLTEAEGIKKRWQEWYSPGKSTEDGCHFLLQCMKVKSESEVAQSCLTPSNPMDCSPPGSPVHGILQARVLEWGAIAFSKNTQKNCSKKIIMTQIITMV